MPTANRVLVWNQDVTGLSKQNLILVTLIYTLFFIQLR